MTSIKLPLDPPRAAVSREIFEKGLSLVLSPSPSRTLYKKNIYYNWIPKDALRLSVRDR